MGGPTGFGLKRGTQMAAFGKRNSPSRGIKCITAAMGHRRGGKIPIREPSRLSLHILPRFVARFAEPR